MQEYDYQCHKMYLITFKVFNIFCADHQSQWRGLKYTLPSTLEGTYSSGWNFI
jgi:hypothetical protein